MWGMLRSGWWWMLEAVQDVWDVGGHGEINCASSTVPVDGDSTMKISCPVGGQCVVFAQGCFQVLSVFLSNVFDAKVINNKGE